MNGFLKDTRRDTNSLKSPDKIYPALLKSIAKPPIAKELLTWPIHH